VRVEKFGLLFPSVGAFAIPPSGALSVEDRAWRPGDGDGGARDGDQRTCPFGISKGGCALEYDLEGEG